MTFGQVTCMILGHKRGKFAYQGVVQDGHRVKTYRCPRCGGEWRRKVRAEPDAILSAPSDGSPHFQELA
jgi:hypothetical protein